MYSREGEEVVLEKEVVCIAGVENWLNTLLTVHQQSIGDVISLGLQTFRTPEFDILSLIENSILQVKSRAHQYACKNALKNCFFFAGGFIGVTSFMDAR